MRIWDLLLSDSNRWNFVFYICIASVQLKRHLIVNADFSDIMTAL